MLRVASELTSVSIFALNLVTGLGLGLAIDYSLFMVSRYREEIARSGPGLEAMRRTMATAGRTVLFSSLTVAAALASLLVFPQRFLYSMGLGGSLVALIAAGLALVVLPAILALLGTRVNSLAPAFLQRRAERDARPDRVGLLVPAVALRDAPAGADRGRERGAADRARDPVPRDQVHLASTRPCSRPRPARARSTPRCRPSSRRIATRRSELAVRGRRPRAAREAERARSSASRASPRSNPPQRLAGGVAEIDVDLALRRRSATEARTSSPRSATCRPGPATSRSPASPPTSSTSSRASPTTCPLALAIVAVATFVVLFLMTGSVVLPIKALLMNVLTLSAVFGILVLIFQDGRFEGLLGYTSQGALEQTQPLLLFAVAFGLSTDYGVFLLSRIKEARDGGASDSEAVAIGLERTGRIVTAAALLFAVAIGAFVTSRDHLHQGARPRHRARRADRRDASSARCSSRR